MPKCQVVDVTLFGLQCMIEVRKRHVVLTSSSPRRYATEAHTIDEAVFLLGQMVNRKPIGSRRRDGNLHLEEVVRASLMVMMLPLQPIPITERHVVPSKGRYIVRRNMYGHRQQRLYFGTYMTPHAAAEASKRLCEIINEEIERRRVAVHQSRPVTSKPLGSE